MHTHTHVDHKAKLAEVHARLKAKGTQTFTTTEGVWYTGPDGSFIATYVLNEWPTEIKLSILDKLDLATTFPKKIG